MKRLKVFLILIILFLPIIRAEITPEYLDKTLDANRKLISQDLENRDKVIENQINDKFNAFMSQIKLNYSLYIFKAGLMIIGSIIIAGISLIYINMIIKKSYRKIQQRKALAIRKKFNEMVYNGKSKPEI